MTILTCPIQYMTALPTNRDLFRHNIIILLFSLLAFLLPNILPVCLAGQTAIRKCLLCHYVKNTQYNGFQASELAWVYFHIQTFSNMAMIL